MEMKPRKRLDPKRRSIRKAQIKSWKRLWFLNSVHEYFSEQSTQSTMHGVNMVFPENIHLCERLFWLASIAAAATASAYLCTPLYERYKTSPTVMSVEMDYFNWNTSFPSISLCPDAKIDKDRLHSFLQNYPEESRHNLSIFVTELAAVNPLMYDTFAVEDSDLIHPKDYAKVVQEVFPDIWKPQMTANTNEPVTRDAAFTDIGMCAVLNSNVAHYDTPSNWGQFPSRYEKRSIELNVHDGMFFIQTFNFSDSYSIFIHSPDDIADLTSLNFRHEVNTFISIYIFIKNTKATKEVKKLSINQRNCRLINEPISSRYNVYSYNRCIRECRIRIMITLCGCIPHFYKPIENEQVCALTKLTCLVNFRKEIQHLSVSRKVKATYPRAAGLPESVRDCGCLQSCEEYVYLEDNVEIAIAKFPLLRIGLEVYPKVRYSMEIIFGFYDAIVRLGGVTNLCLGTSVISVAEILVFFVLRPLFYFLRHWSGRIKQKYIFRKHQEPKQ